MLNSKLSPLHGPEPSLILFTVHRSPSTNHGLRSGIARSKRRIKNEASKRIPKPVPTANSERTFFNLNTSLVAGS